MGWWLGYLVTGAVAGFFTGMLGIGGGSIIVPMLVALFGAQDLPRAHLMHLAVGTALATFLFTSVASVRAHAQRGAIRWDIARRMTPGILAGGVIGSFLSRYVSTAGFAAIFTLVIYAAATSMLIDIRPRASRDLPGTAGMFAAGFLFSGIAAFAAVGGAFMTIPFMMWCGVTLIEAIGTASLIGLPIALSGSVGFMIAGFGEQALPAWSVGYVYLPALAGVVVAGVLAAPLGAAVAHRTPTRWLRRVFAVLFFVVATRMLIALW
ncbi:MAG TPA: sulfite exporter TauE/SafE family protein [Burkholderiales bacterium]